MGFCKKERNWAWVLHAVSFMGETIAESKGKWAHQLTNYSGYMPPKVEKEAVFIDAYAEVQIDNDLIMGLK